MSKKVEQTEAEKTIAAAAAAPEEVKIPMTLSGLWHAIFMTTVKLPASLVGGGARIVEKAGHRMTYGRAAALTMPFGIILRNAARTIPQKRIKESTSFRSWMNESGGWAIPIIVSGAAGWWLGFKAISAAIATSAAGPIVGSVVGNILAGAAAVAVILPAASLGFVVATVAGAAVVGIASIPLAFANIPTALTRSVDAFKGMTYGDDILEPGLSYRKKLQRQRDDAGILNILTASEEDRKALFKIISARGMNNNMYKDLQPRIAFHQAARKEAAAAATPQPEGKNPAPATP